MGFTQLIKFVFLVVGLKLKYYLFATGFSNKPYSIAQVANKYKLKIINTKIVNDQDYINKLAALKPEIIFCTCSQIFKKNLLNLPKIACINRHTALLPSYAGVMPIFWGMLNDEKTMGVTIHYMTPEIDKGVIVFQNSYKLTKSDTLVTAYIKAYESGVQATVSALEIIRLGKPKVRVNKKLKFSYYSFPKSSDWKLFFGKGNKLI